MQQRSGSAKKQDQIIWKMNSEKQIQLFLNSMIILLLLGCKENYGKTKSKKVEKIKIEYDEQTSELISAILKKINENPGKFELKISSQGCFGEESVEKFIFSNSTDFVQIEGFDGQLSKNRWRKSNRIYSKKKFIHLLNSELNCIQYDIVPAGFRSTTQLISSDTLSFKTLKISRLKDNFN